MKTAILLYSTHHGNTAKVAQAIAGSAPDVMVFDVTKTPAPDLSGCELVVLASGVYGGSLAAPLLRAAEASLQAGQKVFLLCTSAMNLAVHLKAARDIAEKKGCTVVGSFRCKGFNTFGPFKLVGGTGKGHPDDNDLAAAVKAFAAVREETA